MTCNPAHLWPLYWTGKSKNIHRVEDDCFDGLKHFFVCGLSLLGRWQETWRSRRWRATAGQVRNSGFQCGPAEGSFNMSKDEMENGDMRLTCASQLKQEENRVGFGTSVSTLVLVEKNENSLWSVSSHWSLSLLIMWNRQSVKPLHIAQKPPSSSEILKCLVDHLVFPQ